MGKNLTSISSTDQRIDSIRLRESDRKAAKAHMRDADIVAELFYRAVENLRSGREILAHLPRAVRKVRIASPSHEPEERNMAFKICRLSISSIVISILAACGGGGGGAANSGPPNLVSIAVAPADPSVRFAQTQQLTANGSYSDG